jgi:hypothetical protein
MCLCKPPRCLDTLLAGLVIGAFVFSRAAASISCCLCFPITWTASAHKLWLMQLLMCHA